MATFIGNGFATLEELTAAANIPCMSEKTFAKEFDKVSSKIHEAAMASMEAAAEEERQYSLLNNNVDTDGVPLCTVVTDGMWGKRSYGTNYSSKSGWVSYYMVLIMLLCP